MRTGKFINGQQRRIKGVFTGEASRVLQGAASVCLGSILIFGVVGCGESHGDNPFEAATSFDVVAESDALHLLFGVPDDEGTSLYYVRSGDGSQWTRPAKVASSHAPPGRHSRGNDPQLAVAGNRLLAVWTALGEGPWGSGPLGAAISEDGGKNWREAPVPASADSGPEAGYRFPALAADADAFHAIWIHAEGEERSLRHARMDHSAGIWNTPGIVDPHICACCWLRLDVDETGNLVALYRDYEPSDMRFALSSDSGRTWEMRGRAGGFDWHFQGCPHVGGGLALGRTDDGEPLAFASVWTGEEHSSGSYVYRSRDEGRTWEVSGNSAEPAGNGRNTDIAQGKGTVALVWDETDGDQAAAVYISLSRDRGRTWGARRRLSTSGSQATHPRIVSHGDTATVLWSTVSPDGPSGIEWQVVDLEGSGSLSREQTEVSLRK